MTKVRAGIPELAGDHLNAARFLERHRHEVRRSPELGCWFTWTGAWWQEDRLERVQDLAGGVIDDLRQWVTEAAEPTEFTRRSRHYEASAKASRRDALLALVGTDPRVVVSVDELDAHPLLLACTNGTVDLTTGELRPADPGDLLTRGIDVDYAADLRSQLWEDFLDEIFRSDHDLIAYVQRLLGYCVTGVVAEHVLPVLSGEGANGKGTLTGLVQDVLGDQAITAPEGLVIAQRHEPHPERLAELRGRRLVVSDELDQRVPLAEATVKMLTGGNTLSARQLYGRRFNFRPTHKLLLVTNHKPQVLGTDHAIWRRVKVVPFDVVIPDERQDPDLRRRLLQDHGPAVLAWLVRGAVEWHRDGLGEAEAVRAATEAYREDEDVLGTFLAERTVAVPRHRTKVGDLWDLWVAWCERTGERTGRKQDFTRALVSAGWYVESHQGIKYVVGLGMRAELG